MKEPIIKAKVFTNAHIIRNYCSNTVIRTTTSNYNQFTFYFNNKKIGFIEPIMLQFNSQNILWIYTY